MAKNQIKRLSKLELDLRVQFTTVALSGLMSALKGQSFDMKALAQEAIDVGEHIAADIVSKIPDPEPANQAANDTAGPKPVNPQPHA